MEKLLCKNCNKEVDTPFCPFCGKKVIQDRVRSLEEIKNMEELIFRAIKLKSEKGNAMFEITVAMLATILFGWIKGNNSSPNPLEMIIKMKELENTEQGRTLMELSHIPNPKNWDTKGGETK